MDCPNCGKSNLRSIVTITIDRPAGSTGVNKKTITSADVVLLAVDWPNEMLICYECNWTNNIPGKEKI